MSTTRNANAIPNSGIASRPDRWCAEPARSPGHRPASHIHPGPGLGAGSGYLVAKGKGEVARRIREMSGGDQRRIIGVSGWGRETLGSRINEAGFDSHWLKPVDVDALLRELHEHLQMPPQRIS